MTQSYIVLLTRRTDAENALIRVLDVNWRASDSLNIARHFTKSEAQKVVAEWDEYTGGDPDLAAWCPTVAPAGEETGVPGEPGGEAIS